MRRSWDLGIVIVCFVLLRVAYFSAYGWVPIGWEEFGHPASDARGYDLVATNLLDGRGFPVLVDSFVLQAYAPPVYPIFLATVYSLYGHDYLAVKLVQQGVSLATCLLLYGAGRRLFNRRTGLIAAILAAAHPGLAFYSSALMTETLFICFLAAIVFLLAVGAESWSPTRSAALGLVTGLAILTRPAGVTLVPAALLLMLWPGGRWLRWRIVLIYVVALGLVVAPWMLRNFWITGGLYFGEIGPRQFWTGANPAFEGASYSRAAWSQVLWRDITASELQRSQRMVREALAFIWQDPEQYLRLSIRRAHGFWAAFPDAPTTHPLGWFSQAVAAMMGAAVLVPAGLLGMARAIAHWRVVAILGVTTIVVAVFHALLGAEPRYQLPFDLLFILAAAYLIALLLDITRVDWRNFGTLCRPDDEDARERHHLSDKMLALSSALLIGVPAVVLLATMALRPAPAVEDCALAPDTVRRVAEELRALHAIPPNAAMTLPTYREVHAARARHRGAVGPLEGTLVVWGGLARYAAETPFDSIQRFDLHVNYGPHTLGDDVIPLTLPRPAAGLAEGQCTIVAGVIQERNVDGDPFAKPLIRPIALFGATGDELRLLMAPSP